MYFGIESWPAIKKTPDGIARRAKDTAKKRGVTKTDDPADSTAMVRSISEGSVVVVPRKTTKGAGSLVATSSQHMPSDDVGSVAERPSELSYREEWVPFVDLAALEAAAKIPGRTPTQVKAAIADLCSIREREVSTINRLTRLAGSRSAIYNDILVSMQKDLRGLLREEEERAEEDLLALDEEDEPLSEGSRRSGERSEYDE